MATNFREIARRVMKETPEYATGAQLVDEFVDSLKTKGLLPERLPEPEASEITSRSSVRSERRERQQGIQLTCRCNYEWMYKGRLAKASCPNCGNKVATGRSSAVRMEQLPPTSINF